MDYNIIVDSCCDLTNELKKRLGIVSVPLTLRLGEQEFTDDDHLDLEGFMTKMKACIDKVGSAAPAPSLFRDAMVNAGRSFVVTLSGKLSGTYASAMTGRSYVEKDGADVHVFDSKSASAGETLTALKLYELIREGLNYEEIVKTASRFIDNMKTYFVLDNYDNLIKNGRIHKVTESLIRVLNIKLIMGADGEGDIALFGKALGTRQAVARLLNFIQQSGKQTDGENMVISHCNNAEVAQQLAIAAKERFQFKDIIVIPTGGVSSLYADNRGVIMAF